MAARHTDPVYEKELSRLCWLLELMGRKIDQMIEASRRALADRDAALAEETIAFDHQINRIEVESDELCLRMLARRQPVASDLRFITLALKLVTDLERVGDLCVNVCERTLELAKERPFDPPVQVAAMFEAVRGMVKQALRAFLQGDEPQALEVMTRDKKVDADYGQVLGEVFSRMKADPAVTYAATRIQSVAKYLERMGDHATNLAEMAVFRVRGKDVRHLGKLEEPEELLLGARG